MPWYREAVVRCVIVCHRRSADAVARQATPGWVAEFQALLENEQVTT